MATSVTTSGGRNAAASGVASAITHWGLVDTAGTELTGGAYARVARSATATANVVNPSSDVAINVPASATVGGVRAYTASTGGTNLGGWDYPSGAGNGRETFDAAGVYTVTATSSNFTVS